MDPLRSVFDLHTHSTASDGTLSPNELVNNAHTQGVEVLALTDHDTTAGLAEAQATASQRNMEFVPSIELSATWRDGLLHIVGLNIDPESPSLKKGIAGFQATREWRAEEMGRRLAQCGIQEAYEGARDLAGDGTITRTHFARFLVNRGYSANVREVFKHYLVKGKPGYVTVSWASLEEAISWIDEAGGVPVLAHPMRYRLTDSRLRRVLAAFKSAGGIAIEVVCGNSTPTDIAKSAGHARRYRLMGSVGSDYHGPDNAWIKLGKLAELPAGIDPVWQTWRR